MGILTEKLKVVVRPVPCEQAKWLRYLGPCCAMIATTLRKKLTLNVFHKGQVCLVDTDVPNGIPAVQRKRSAELATRYQKAFGVLDDRSLTLMPLQERTAIFLSLKEIEKVRAFDY